MVVHPCIGGGAAAALALVGCLAMPGITKANEADARSRFKAMSDYMSSSRKMVRS